MINRIAVIRIDLSPVLHGHGGPWIRTEKSEAKTIICF